MRKFIQIVKLNIPSGEVTRDIDVTFQSGGYPTHCAVFGINKITDVLTKAAIKDGAGVEIVPMHNINNFRDREAGYAEGKMPIDMKGSNRANFSVLLDGTETTQRNYDLVFLMETEN